MASLKLFYCPLSKFSATATLRSTRLICDEGEGHNGGSDRRLRRASHGPGADFFADTISPTPRTFTSIY